jgi:hypothetical protein
MLLMDGPTIDIIVGCHSGVKRTLEKQTYRIGSAPGADIILRDPGVEPEHVTLSVDAFEARVEAVGGDVGLGADLLSKGYGCVRRYPFDLSLGLARIRFTGNAKSSMMRPIRNFIANHPLTAGGGVIAAMLLLGLLTGQSLHGYDQPPKSEDLVSTTAVGLDADEAIHELKKRLDDAGIQGLSISKFDGRVSVSGVIPNGAAAAWTAIQQWFDQTYKGRLLLTTAVAFGEDKALTIKLRLQAIWFGDRPYFITDDGIHRYEGGSLRDGWVIKEIRDNHIKLAKDGQTLMLTY